MHLASDGRLVMRNPITEELASACVLLVNKWIALAKHGRGGVEYSLAPQRERSSATNLESRIPRTGAEANGKKTGGARPPVGLPLSSNLLFYFLALHFQTGSRFHRDFGRRVRSWLRMNAGGAPNTCKSSGEGPFGDA